MRMLRPLGAVLVAALVPVLASAVASGGEPAKYAKYASKYKKRGQVRGFVVALPFRVVYAGVIQAFSSAKLTVNSENDTLGFVEGGHSRGISGELLRVWIDHEGESGQRIEVRNIRISRMGLIGLATTKDRSVQFLDELRAVLDGVPSLAQLSSAASANPASLEARRGLIESYLAAGQNEAAAREYRILLEQHPQSFADRTRLAEMLLAAGKLDAAAVEFALAKDHSPEAALSLARLQVQTGQARAAVELLAALAERQPSDLKLKYNLGRAALLAGELDRARALLAEVIEQAPPEHALAVQARAWLQLVSSGFAPDAPRPDQALLAGEQLAKEGLAWAARSYLERAAASLAPGVERARAYAALSRVCVDQRDYAAVRRVLEPQARQWEQEKRGDLLYALALAQCAERDFVKAAVTAKAASKSGSREAKSLAEALKSYV